MNDLTKFTNQIAKPETFDQIQIGLASPRAHPHLVLRRDQEARDHQLPHVQARARRPVLRAHLRSGEGLRVPVRQVQAHEVQGRRLRKVRRRGDRHQGPPRAHGPHRTGRAGRAHLVPEVAAVAHRPAARHAAQAARAGPLLRKLHRHRAGPDPAREVPAADRGRALRVSGRIRRRRLLRRDRRRSGQAHADGPRPGAGKGRPARGAVRRPSPSSSPRRSSSV